MLIGAHMSVAGGLHLALERGQKVGCRTIQIFTKNDRQWQAKPISDADLEAWFAACAASPIAPILTHDSYLINLASPDLLAWEKSLAAFRLEIDRTQLLKIPYLVTHAGAHMGSGEEAGLKQVATAINRLHHELTEETGNNPITQILLETTAGQGSAVGYKFEHYTQLLEQLDHPEWVGVCFDTCHVFAAGYDISTSEGWHATMSEFDRLIGLNKLQAFHVNDSIKGLGSKVDRHEALGKGALGLVPFRELMLDPRFANVPKVLETPKGPDNAEDVENLAVLRQLATGTFPE